ncbi:hypothetical protein NDU88_000268 [Pleurodeles waltl]|uniref:Uncharacterized protein n=1 Tax=Pleurodeles waltl TaxID=8319 RepID=A0AAV7L991_PLEWA|nr:hypothetical protein NDU88_000268 [Pleurodeles waltl]
MLFKVKLVHDLISEQPPALDFKSDIAVKKASHIDVETFLDTEMTSRIPFAVEVKVGVTTSINFESSLVIETWHTINTSHRSRNYT